MWNVGSVLTIDTKGAVLFGCWAWRGSCAFNIREPFIGDRREAIFYDDADGVEFLRTSGQACLKTKWQVHAYCLMSNHFHLVLESHQWIADRQGMRSSSYVSNLLGSVDSKL